MPVVISQTWGSNRYPSLTIVIIHLFIILMKELLRFANNIALSFSSTKNKSHRIEVKTFLNWRMQKVIRLWVERILNVLQTILNMLLEIYGGTLDSILHSSWYMDTLWRNRIKGESITWEYWKRIFQYTLQKTNVLKFFRRLKSVTLAPILRKRHKSVCASARFVQRLIVVEYSDADDVLKSS